jgi:hypothetical protein
MRLVGDSLVGAPPGGPCDDTGGFDAVLCQAVCYAAYFLGRPADQSFGDLVAGRFVFWGVALLA